VGQVHRACTVGRKKAHVDAALLLFAQQPFAFLLASVFDEGCWSRGGLRVGIVWRQASDDERQGYRSEKSGVETVAISVCAFFHGGATGVISLISENSPVLQRRTFHFHFTEIQLI
jgi:hypothetical protein